MMCLQEMDAKVSVMQPKLRSWATAEGHNEQKRELRFVKLAIAIRAFTL
jgi:hypothetical protein